MPYVVGCDFSMSSPGLCLYDGDENFTFQKCSFYSLSTHKIPSTEQFNFKIPSEYDTEQERYSNLADWVLDAIGDEIPDLIGIEDYSMGSKGRTFNIGECCGILKDRLWKNNLPFITIPPTVVKKFATGKGNAKKEQMVEQFRIDTGLDLKAELQPKRQLGSPTTDLVDAYYIARYTLDFHMKNML